jgi:hypothetical protein
MRVHSEEKIREIKKLRQSGFSIGEIIKKTSLPKTTIWHHIHSIKLSPKDVALIKSKQGGSKIRSKNEWDKADADAKEILRIGGNKKFYCSVLSMLYWAEGNKKGFVFTNTEGNMIKLFILILNKYFDISDNRIDLIIRVFSNLNKKECLSYWSKVVGLPKNKFRIYFNDGGTKGKAKYGICRLSVKKGGYLFKLTTSIINNILKQVA